MILFVSGRCDIPAFYSKWFYNRLQEGFVDVRNPFQPHSISRIYLQQDQIDAILFCTKNPIPMIPRLAEITLPYIFHITLTPYHYDIEEHVPDKQKIIKAIHKLSDMLGRQRVIVRYDPILLSDRYTITYHVQAFQKLCHALEGIIDTIIISFVDIYKNTEANQRIIGMRSIQDKDMHEIAKHFGEIGVTHHIKVQTCAEHVNLTMYQIENKLCIDVVDLEKRLNLMIRTTQKKGVRGKQCACVSSVDIGDYNCCKHNCLYCYANYDAHLINERCQQHDPDSSVLLGHITDLDHVHERKEALIKQLHMHM